MKTNRKELVLLLCLLFLLLGSIVPALAGEQVTILGTVNASYQIVTEDQQVYDVAESEQGDEVVEMIGQKVKVTGTIEEQDDVKIIMVTSYEVIEE
jgi:hypothetical protein